MLAGLAARMDAFNASRFVRSVTRRSREDLADLFRALSEPHDRIGIFPDRILIVSMALMVSWMTSPRCPVPPATPAGQPGRFLAARSTSRTVASIWIAEAEVSSAAEERLSTWPATSRIEAIISVTEDVTSSTDAVSSAVWLATSLLDAFISRIADDVSSAEADRLPRSLQWTGWMRISR